MILRDYALKTEEYSILPFPVPGKKNIKVSTSWFKTEIIYRCYDFTQSFKLAPPLFLIFNIKFYFERKVKAERNTHLAISLTRH